MKRMAAALRRDTIRNKKNKPCRQSTLPAHWPTLIPQSLPIRPAPRPVLPSQPNNLHNYGWKPDPNFRIRIHTPPHADYPFEYPPTTTPRVAHFQNSTVSITPPVETVTPEDIAQDDQWLPHEPDLNPCGTPHPAPQGPDTHLLHPTVPPPATDISILTLNIQKAGHNSPSLTDLVTILDLHKPDILLLTETPMHPHQGALTQALCNRGYKTHYNLVNSPSL
jgi:hypothetical protein